PEPQLVRERDLHGDGRGDRHDRDRGDQGDAALRPDLHRFTRNRRLKLPTFLTASVTSIAGGVELGFTPGGGQLFTVLPVLSAKRTSKVSTSPSSGASSGFVVGARSSTGQVMRYSLPSLRR